MTYRIFGRPYSGSLAVEWLLQALDLHHTRVLVTGYGDGIQPPWFRDINPICQVPALELPDGTVMTESGAMMLYLADMTADAGLAPLPGGPARPDYLRWMIFLSATVYPTMMQFFHPENYIDNPGQFEAIKSHAKAVLPGQWAMIETGLDKTGYLAGNSLSAADIYLLMFAVWMDGSFSLALEHYSRIKHVHDELTVRPPFADILSRHKSGAWSD